MCNSLSIFHGENVRAAVYVIDRPISTHVHREGHLQFHVEGESACAQVCDKPFALSPHSACAINPWQPHSFTPGTIGKRAIFLVLYIKPDWFSEQELFTNHSHCFGRTQLDVSDKISMLVLNIVRLVLDNNNADSLEFYLNDLTSTCFDKSWEHQSHTRSFCKTQYVVRDFRVKKSMALMSNNFNGNVDFNTVAKEAGLSRPHFYQLFRQHTGITPNLYVNMLRLERSIEYLTQSDRTISDISSELGFGSQSGFSRFFCSNTGVAPTMYRNAAFMTRE